jgi:hypothetical protein
MRENKYERDRAEFEEADQELKAKVLEEMERGYRLYLQNRWNSSII